MDVRDWVYAIWDTVKIVTAVFLFALFVGACLFVTTDEGADRECLREETLRYVNGGHDVDTARWLAGTSGVCDG